jgi:hypothetical protein
MNVGLGLNEQFEPGQHGQFGYVVYADAGSELRRSGRPEGAGFELKIPNRRKRRWCRYSGPRGVCIRYGIGNSLPGTDTAKTGSPQQTSSVFFIDSGGLR